MGFEASYNDPVSNVLVSLWGGGFNKNRDTEKNYLQLTQPNV